MAYIGEGYEPQVETAYIGGDSQLTYAWENISVNGQEDGAYKPGYLQPRIQMLQVGQKVTVVQVMMNQAKTVYRLANDDRQVLLEASRMHLVYGREAKVVEALVKEEMLYQAQMKDAQDRAAMSLIRFKYAWGWSKASNL